MLINVTIAGIYYGLSFSNLGMVFSYLKLTWLMISLGGFENSCRFAVLWGYRLGQNPRPCHGVGAEGRGWLGQLKQLNRGWRFWFGTSVLMYMCMHMYVYIYIYIYTYMSHIPKYHGWLMYVDVYILPGLVVSDQPIVERLSISWGHPIDLATANYFYSKNISNALKLYPAYQCMLWM